VDLTRSAKIEQFCDATSTRPIFSSSSLLRPVHTSIKPRRRSAYCLLHRAVSQFRVHFAFPVMSQLTSEFGGDLCFARRSILPRADECRKAVVLRDSLQLCLASSIVGCIMPARAQYVPPFRFTRLRTHGGVIQKKLTQCTYWMPAKNPAYDIVLRLRISRKYVTKS